MKRNGLETPFFCEGKNAELVWNGQGRIKYFSSWSSWISAFFIDIAPKGSKNYGQQTARSSTLSSNWVGRGETLRGNQHVEVPCESSQFM